MSRMGFFWALVRVCILIATTSLIGWTIGFPMTGALIGFALVLTYWSYQLWSMDRWLIDPERPPSTAFGLWHDRFMAIYKRQRRSAREVVALQGRIDYLMDSFESMRDGVVIVDVQGSVKWCNTAACDQLGLRYPQDNGQILVNLVRDPVFVSYFSERNFKDPLQFVVGDHERITLEVTVTQFADQDLLLFFRDVSKLARLEQMRRDFVGNVSHELRTPLTVIAGYLDTLLGDTEHLPKPYVRPIEQMLQQTARMENLLNDLLWLSRIESDERKEKVERVSMKTLLDELREELQISHPDRKLEMVAACCDRIDGDYRELYSAVSNLVLNAFKYSEADDLVSVRWHCDDGVARLDVSDEGIGIEQRHIARLTERFYRVDDSRSSTTGGTGLGLAIVKHVALSHNARLEIHSEYGKGSCFSLLFPRVAMSD